MASRFEVRLDKNHRGRLDVLAASKGVTASKIVRELIDKAYEEKLREHRLLAAEELSAMNAVVPPDPAELSRLLETAHDTCGIRDIYLLNSPEPGI